MNKGRGELFHLVEDERAFDVDGFVSIIPGLPCSEYLRYSTAPAIGSEHPRKPGWFVSSHSVQFHDPFYVVVAKYERV